MFMCQFLSLQKIEHYVFFMHSSFLPVYRESLHGVKPILHYIARSASFSSFSGKNNMEFGHVCCGQVLIRKSPYFHDLFFILNSELMLSINLQVVEWLDYAPTFFSGSEFENACSFVDGFLASRTFLVGHGLTVADIAVWSNLAGKLWVCLPFFFQACSRHCNIYQIVSFFSRDWSTVGESKEIKEIPKSCPLVQ
jgi:hypothetical protein